MGKPEPQPWNVCDDFLDPLADLMLESQYDPASGRPQMYPHMADYRRKLQKATSRDAMRFGLVWLQVEISPGVADYIQKKVGSTEDEGLGSWADVAETGAYLRDLALVIRERQGKSIQKSDIPEELRTPPMTKTCIAEIFDKHRNAIDDSFIAEKQGKKDGRRYYFPTSEMSAGWESVYEKHRRNKPKQKKSR